MPFRIYFSFLPHDLTEKDLFAVASLFGRVKAAHVMTAPTVLLHSNLGNVLSYIEYQWRENADDFYEFCEDFYHRDALMAHSCASWCTKGNVSKPIPSGKGFATPYLSVVHRLQVATQDVLNLFHCEVHVENLYLHTSQEVELLLRFSSPEVAWAQYMHFNTNNNNHCVRVLWSVRDAHKFIIQQQPPPNSAEDAATSFFYPSDDSGSDTNTRRPKKRLATRQWESILPEWTFLKKLSQGNHAYVYLAQHVHSNVLGAVKVMKLSVFTEREIRCLRDVSDRPGLTSILHQSNCTETRTAYVVLKLAGKDLMEVYHDCFEKRNEESDENVRNAFAAMSLLGMLRSLQEFHACGYKHKSVKPENFCLHALDPRELVLI
eukprot:PhF_6_TR30141/c0_g1_i2/m.44107